MFESFSMGIPDFHSLILVEGYGYGQLRGFCEDGTVQVYMGFGRTMTIPGEARWRYCNYGV